MKSQQRFSSAVTLPFPPLGTAEMAVLTEQIDRLDEPTFRRFQFELVSRYRTEHQEQEQLEMGLLEALRSRPSWLAAERIEETLAMLVHVHDPLIS